MRLLAQDQPVLDALSGAAPRIIARTLDWCAVNSGSRNAEGLARQRDLLESELAVLPGHVERAPLSPSREVRDDGSLGETSYATPCC